MGSDVVKSQTHAAWKLRTTEASIKLTVSGMKQMQEFQGSKCFYFCSHSCSKGTKISDSAEKEWRLVISFDGSNFIAEVFRQAATAVRVTDGGFTISLPSKSFDKSCKKILATGRLFVISPSIISCNEPQWIVPT